VYTTPVIIPIGDQPNPRGTPYVNYALLAANAVVFLAISVPLMYRAPDLHDPAVQAFLRDLLSRYPGANPDAVVYGTLQHLSAYDIFLTQWGYRPAHPSVIALFTSMFLHGGWLHLIGNMLFLWIYGDNVEHRLGRVGYLAAYLVTGVLAALSYGAFLSGSAGDTPMVGASGAISGVLGFYFLWFPRNKVRLLVLLFPFFVFDWLVGARIVLGFYLIVENLLPLLLIPAGAGGGVAHGAHLGGFVAGLGAAFLADRWAALRCRRRAERCGARVTAVPLAARRHDPASVVEAHREERLGEAVALYTTLPAAGRRQIPVGVAVDLAEHLVLTGEPDGALGIYRHILQDHPRGPGLDRIFLGIGLVLLHGKGRPAAAYQYLMDALDADPAPGVEQSAREALEHIASLQKLQVRQRRPG
jgi:membrane associated rhomboid family serine protease